MWWIAIAVTTIFVSFIGMIINKKNGHADNKHSESQLVRDMFNRNGAFEVWQENEEKNVFHYIVDLCNGTYGDWIVFQNMGVNTERTVFIPKDGKLSSITSWLKTKAHKI